MPSTCNKENNSLQSRNLAAQGTVISNESSCTTPTLNLEGKYGKMEIHRKLLSNLSV